MANTYTSLHDHLIFSTKMREPWIVPQIQGRLWAYLGGIARQAKLKHLAFLQKHEIQHDRTLFVGLTRCGLKPHSYLRVPPCGKRRSRGFSFVEVIGVLAILVILAVLIVPRVASRGGVVRSVGAVNQAAVDQVLASVRALATAATEHRARFGSLASRNGTPFAVSPSYDRYDAVLISEQLLDQPFHVRLGSGATVRLLNVSRGSATVGSGAYDLLSTGAGGGARATYVLEAVMPGLSDSEARALNDGLDGPALGAQPGQDDSRGKVTYRGGDPGQAREAHIYITHE